MFNITDCFRNKLVIPLSRCWGSVLFEEENKEVLFHSYEKLSAIFQGNE